MLLDEVRMMSKRKKEQLDNNPKASDASKNYYKTVEKMLSNSDYLIESPKSLVIELLYFVGYDFDSLNSIYDQLMEELKGTFKAVSVNQLDSNSFKMK